MNKHPVWGNKWIIIGQLGLILLVLIGLIILAYFMGRKYITPSTENFTNTIDPDIKIVESQLILDEKPFFQSFGFIKDNKFMLINTLLKNTTIPSWATKPNMKYILDYGIGIPAPANNGYYLMTFENKPLSNIFYGITVLSSCSMGIKPAETTQSKITYYFPGYTFTYYPYTKADDGKYKALMSAYSAMMRKYTNGSNFLNGGKNLINLQASSPSGNKIIDISYYSSSKQKLQDIVLKAKISGNNLEIIPILIDEQYLAPDNITGQYVEITDDDGTGGDVDHSIHANKTTGNIIPIVGANNSYLKNYFQIIANSIKAFYNWNFTNKKMTDYLALVLYPETDKYVWTELPGCYWLTISDSSRQFINEVVPLEQNTKKNISSIVITDNPETSFKIYKSSYTDPVSKNQVPIYKYVSANTNKILCVQVCNYTDKTPNSGNILYLEDVVKDKIIPIDLNSNRITAFNTNRLWHNLRKPWHIFESNKLFGAMSGINRKTSVITSIKSSNPNQRQLVCNVENLDDSYDAKPLTAFFNYQITPPVPTDGNVIQNLYILPGFNTYLKIISHTLKIGNISMKYFKISTYTNDSLTNNKVFHPEQPQVSNANIFFLPYETSADILLYKKYYAFASNCILTYTIPSQLDSTNTDYTKFTQYTRVDPITNYVLDTTNKYSINSFGSQKFVKRTAGSYSIFETEDGLRFVILNISTNNFELIPKAGINIEKRGTTFSDTGFIYYKYNLRFREIDSNRYAIFEFPLENKAISSKILSVIKLLEPNTTVPTTTIQTTTEPTTTQGITRATNVFGYATVPIQIR